VRGGEVRVRRGVRARSRPGAGSAAAAHARAGARRRRSSSSTLAACVARPSSCGAASCCPRPAHTSSRQPSSSRVPSANSCCSSSGACTSGSSASRCCASTGPASHLSTVYATLTPVSATPACARGSMGAGSGSGRPGQAGRPRPGRGGRAGGARGTSWARHARRTEPAIAAQRGPQAHLDGARHGRRAPELRQQAGVDVEGAQPRYLQEAAGQHVAVGGGDAQVGPQLRQRRKEGLLRAARPAAEGSAARRQLGAGWGASGQLGTAGQRAPAPRRRPGAGAQPPAPRAAPRAHVLGLGWAHDLGVAQAGVARQLLHRRGRGDALVAAPLGLARLGHHGGDLQQPRPDGGLGGEGRESERMHAAPPPTPALRCARPTSNVASGSFAAAKRSLSTPAATCARRARGPGQARARLSAARRAPAPPPAAKHLRRAQEDHSVPGRSR
jgi:hypothetical protein